MKKNIIKIYRFDNEEWDVVDFYAAENFKEAKKEYLSDVSEDEDWFAANVKTSELTAEELNELQMSNDEDRKLFFAAVLEQLVDEGAMFPRAFASSEY